MLAQGNLTASAQPRRLRPIPAWNDGFFGALSSAGPTRASMGSAPAAVSPSSGNQ
jgi:hypothetical protein